jgi:hypothetical protein
MTMATATLATPDTTTAVQLLDMIGASWMSQAICVAAELRIPDLLANGPRTASALAADTQCAPEALHRLLRGLATLGICSEEPDGTYALTSMGALLRSDADDGVRAWAIWWGRHLWPIWQNLQLSVRTGRSVRELASGTTGYGHVESDPAAAAVFNRAMVDLTHLIAGEFVRSYDCSAARRIVDVGGGHGALLSAILAAHPHAQGVLFDLPHAIKNTRAQIAGSALAARLECIEGSFFEGVPEGADLYLLKSVLHNWSDAQAAVILSHCHRAMPAHAKMVLIERMMPERIQGSTRDRASARTDLNMMVGLGGRERTGTELAALLTASRFRVTQSRPLEPEYTQIECVCA